MDVSMFSGSHSVGILWLLGFVDVSSRFRFLRGSTSEVDVVTETIS